MKSDTKLFLLSLLGLSLPCLFYLGPSPAQGPGYRLVIATSSQIANAEHRNVVRTTWKRYLPPSVLFKFVLGDSGCPIDPLWRLRPDLCSPWQLQVPGWIQDGTPLIPFGETDSSSSRSGVKETLTGPVYEGFTFLVKNFPIVVHRLGLWRPLLDSLGLNETVTVGLRNRRTNELLFHVTFSAADRAANGGGGGYYAFQPLNKIRRDLPANFEGSLQLRIRNATGSRLALLPTAFQPRECAVKFHFQLGNPGIFVITGLRSASQPRAVPFRTDSCPLVNMEYSIMDVFDVKQHLGARETHNIVEERRVKEEEKSVYEEVEDHDDLFFVQNYDTLSDLPHNMKIFLTSMVNSVDFDYILFTTDQSFLHITNILHNLDQLDSAGGVWWARFNHFQLVGEADTYAQDLHYPALSFPPLPASRSFVLSRRLAAFLAANADQLDGYSSWAASLAVWLAAVSPQLVDDKRWRDASELASLSELSSASDILAVDNLSARDMEEIWRVV